MEWLGHGLASLGDLNFQTSIPDIWWRPLPLGLCADSHGFSCKFQPLKIIFRLWEMAIDFFICHQSIRPLLSVF